VPTDAAQQVHGLTAHSIYERDAPGMTFVSSASETCEISPNARVFTLVLEGVTRRHAYEDCASWRLPSAR
jgi:hypothetical protein